MRHSHCDKLGLALSGGGFRASLFHLGVLSQMAELGLLRHVEVISTVSGGSIIGALYYLHVKRLLESKPDQEVTDDDYRSIILTMETDFLYGVQKNLRMRTFANPAKNWKMRRPDYNRSHRMGELYDQYFYRHVFENNEFEMVPMRELKIIPYGESDGFHPRRHNGSRSAKVPILVINATSLNTGRNWRFEATRMGEPPRLSRLDREIDKVTRLLRPPSYDGLAKNLRSLALGTAVAASTAVPGLFHPLAVSDMYPDRRIELVDGGVHDNQGIQGLLDEGCERLIVSDASGQMGEDQNPGTTLASVLTRTNSVMMHRLREEQLFGVTEGTRADSVGLIHLQQGLPTEIVPWEGATVEKELKQSGESRRHTIDPEVQRLLARVRTDLDSFTDVEAFSLTYLGYELTRQTLQHNKAMAQFTGRPKKVDWQFLAIRPWMEHPTPDFLKQLEVASGTLFKVFRLQPKLRNIVLAPVMLAAAYLLTMGRDWLMAPRTVQLTWSWWQVAAVAAAVCVPVGAGIMSLRRTVQGIRKPLEWVNRLLFRSVLPILGALFIQIYLATFDRIFLWQGRVDRLTPPPTGEATSADLGRRRWFGRRGTGKRSAA